MRFFRNVHPIYTVTHLVSVNKGAAKLIWKRLPIIAAYVATFLVLFTAFGYVLGQAERAYYRHLPASHFVNYTSFVVTGSFEGEDVPYSLCRIHDQDYFAKGVRTVYQIVDTNKTPVDSNGNQILVLSTGVNGAIQGANCAAFTLKQAQVHLKPGSYRMTIIVRFTVKYGIEKQETVKSNIFRIRENTGGNSDVQVQLNNLQQQVQALQDALNQLSQKQGSSVRVTTPSPSQPSTTNNTTNNTVNNPPPATTPTTPTTPVCTGITLPLVHTCVL